MCSGFSVNITRLINDAIDCAGERPLTFRELAFKYGVKECEIQGVMDERLESGTLSSERFSRVLGDLKSQNLSELESLERDLFS